MEMTRVVSLAPDVFLPDTYQYVSRLRAKWPEANCSYLNSSLSVYELGKATGPWHLISGPTKALGGTEYTLQGP